MIEAPLSVCGGARLNVPHPGAATAQVTVQSTPLPALSFATVALMLAVPLTGMEEGGETLNAIEITGTLTVTMALANLVWSVVEVAVMVTAVAGTTVGAVYRVAEPLAVCRRLKVPQVPPVPGVQFMVQSTPAFAISFETVAATFTAAPVAIVAGGASPVVKTTEIAAEGVTVTEPLTKANEDAVDVAMIETVRLLVSPVGAVYVDGEPLRVCRGAMLPQFDEPAQETLQVTPAPVASPVT
jgi:hypothetical protein